MFLPFPENERCCYARYGNGQNRYAELGYYRSSGRVQNFTLQTLTSNKIKRKLYYELSPIQDCEKALPKLALCEQAEDSQQFLFDFFQDTLLLLCGSQISRILLYPDIEVTQYVDSHGIEFGFSEEKLLVSIGVRGIGWQLAEMLL